MGTRCLTVMNDSNGEEIAVLYRQFDGYPDGHGQQLADFLNEFMLGNGIPYNLDEQLKKQKKKKFANGMNCLAAQIIAHFKDGAGGFYLYKAGTRDCGEEYIYTVYEKNGQIYLKVQAGVMTFFGSPGTKQEDMNVLFDDKVSEYNPEKCAQKDVSHWFKGKP